MIIEYIIHEPKPISQKAQMRYNYLEPYMSTNMTNQSDPPKVLYHVKRTMVDWHHDKSGATQFTKVTGTFVDLAVAKAAARICLFEEGYSREWFASFETKISELAKLESDVWKYGDGVILHAVAASGEEFFVDIDTVENPVKLDVSPTPSGELICPLYHVLQANVFYNEDRCGARRSVQIEGTYLTAEEAETAARGTLLTGGIKKAAFEEYDERAPEEKDWEFGEDVIIHAVTQTGENILVSIQETAAKEAPTDVDHYVTLMK